MGLRPTAMVYPIAGLPSDIPPLFFIPATGFWCIIPPADSEADIMRGGYGLKPSSEGKRVAFDGDSRTVSGGPFPVTGELVAGFWLWEVKDMDEAVEWMKRSPNPMPGPSEIEIRPLFEVADFGDAMTPELAEQEGRLREKLDNR